MHCCHHVLAPFSSSSPRTCSFQHIYTFSSSRFRHDKRQPPHFLAHLIQSLLWGRLPIRSLRTDKNCSGGGPSISFPFFLPTAQESYCGYPGFAIICRDGLPLLHLSEDEYIVEDIFYSNRSLHVFNAAALLLEENISSCAPRIRNTSLPAGRFDYVGGETFHLLYDCKNVSEELLRYEVGCNSSRETSNNETLAMYGGNGNLRRALERCEENVAARVELYGDEREDEIVDVAAVLRRGFLMNWTSSDCSTCQESGGRCGFNDTSFHFRCFCPDGPHSRSCKPRNASFKKILLIGGITITALTSFFIVIFVFIRRKRAKEKQEHNRDIELFLKNNGNLAPMRYKYSSIKKMMNSFTEHLG